MGKHAAMHLVLAMTLASLVAAQLGMGGGGGGRGMGKIGMAGALAGAAAE